jgi:hypothetical protein
MSFVLFLGLFMITTISVVNSLGASILSANVFIQTTSTPTTYNLQPTTPTPLPSTFGPFNNCTVPNFKMQGGSLTFDNNGDDCYAVHLYYTVKNTTTSSGFRNFSLSISTGM